VPRVSSFELPISASHNHLLRVPPVVGCRSKTPTGPTGQLPALQLRVNADTIGLCPLPSQAAVFPGHQGEEGGLREGGGEAGGEREGGQGRRCRRSRPGQRIGIGRRGRTGASSDSRGVRLVADVRLVHYRLRHQRFDLCMCSISV
jgi:hypothetical protein